MSFSQDAERCGACFHSDGARKRKFLECGGKWNATPLSRMQSGVARWLPPHSKTTSNTWNLFSNGWKLVLLVPLLFTACKPEKIQPLEFDGQRAYSEVEQLVAISPRDAGTSNAWKAAYHIFQRLETFGVDAEIVPFDDITPTGVKTFRNVIGRIRGKTDQWIILGSHYDTKSGIDGFQGANDSGSSTGVLLELARVMKGRIPDIGILFAFFDGEECMVNYTMKDGLHGSRQMAGQLVISGEVKKMRAMILLDMVGDPDLNFNIPYNSSRALVKIVFEAAHATGHRPRFALVDSIITDDHVPFLAADIPSIDLIDFRFGSKPGQNDYWHTDKDRMENISAESLKITGDVVMEMLNGLLYEDKSE